MSSLLTLVSFYQQRGKEGTCLDGQGSHTLSHSFAPVSSISCEQNDLLARDALHVPGSRHPDSPIIPVVWGLCWLGLNV